MLKIYLTKFKNTLCFIFPKNQKSSSLQVIGFICSIYSLISSQGELGYCVTKRSAFLFALKSTFNVSETVTMYKAPKEQNNNYHAEICPDKKVC